MAQTIKFVFISTADESPFVAIADGRAMELCRAYLDKTLSIPPPDILRFVHFNHFNNNIQENIRIFDFPPTTGATTPPNRIRWTPLDTFAPSGDVRFLPSTFIDRADRLGILQVYHSIRGAPPGSVLELGIFSHATPGGPLPRNKTGPSSDDVQNVFVNNLPIRTPNDTAGRARTDFEANMGEDPTQGQPANNFPRTGGKNALAEFKAAFDPMAQFLIGGCEGQDSIRDANKKFLYGIKSTALQLIMQTYVRPLKASVNERLKTTKSTRAQLGDQLRGGRIPTAKIDIDMLEEFRDERRDATDQDPDRRAHYHVYDENDAAKDNDLRRVDHYGIEPGFFPTDNSTSFQKTVSEVQGFIARRMKEMYAFKAADSLGIRQVQAGPLGVKSNVIERDKLPGDDRLQMRVCGALTFNREGFYQESDPECMLVLEFYQQIMGMKRGDRNFFIFDAAAVTKIKSLA